MSSKSLQWLAADIERQRRGELQQELKERRQMEAMGIDPSVIRAARATAAAEAMAQVLENARIPYQMEIPGVGSTLMSLRSREPSHPAEAAAAGVVGPVGWQRVPEPMSTQLELDFGGPMNGIRRTVPLQGRTVAVNSTEPERMAGDRLMRLLAYASMAAGAGVGVAAEVNDEDGSQF